MHGKRRGHYPLDFLKPHIIKVAGDGITQDSGNLDFNFQFTATIACPADVTGDGAVDVQDLVAVVLSWGGFSGPADVTGDGAVDVQDLVSVVLAWGSCP